MPGIETGSGRLHIAADTKQVTESRPAPAKEEPRTRSSYRLADVAVHRVRQWVSGNSGKLTQETLFRESFNKGSQARQALEHAFDDAAPQLFDDVVADFVRGVPKGAKGPTVQELVSGLLLSGLNKNPGLQDLLANLAAEAPKGDKSKRVSESTYAYNAVAMLGLEPAIRRRLAAGGISADQRAALREMKDALVNLRLGTGGQTRQLTNWFAELKGPGADRLNSHNAERLQAASGKVKSDVQKAVADTTQTLKGERIFLGPDWAAARASLSDAIRLGAGDALRNFVNHAAAEAVQQGKKGADLAVFMAGKLGAAPLESIVPKDSQLGKLLAEVRKMAPEGEARNHAVSNLLLVCGISEAARASTSLTSGKHRDALKVMAAVAQGMADGRPGALTRWLGPAKTEALTKAMKDGALAFRNTLSSGDFRRDSQGGGPEDPTVFYTDPRGSGPRGSSSSSASSSGSSTQATGDFAKPGTPSSSDSETQVVSESKSSVHIHPANSPEQVQGKGAVVTATTTLTITVDAEKLSQTPVSDLQPVLDEALVPVGAYLVSNVRTQTAGTPPAELAEEAPAKLQDFQNSIRVKLQSFFKNHLASRVRYDEFAAMAHQALMSSLATYKNDPVAGALSKALEKTSSGDEAVIKHSDGANFWKFIENAPRTSASSINRMS